MDGTVTNQDLYNLIQNLVRQNENIQEQARKDKEEIKEEIRTIKAEVVEELVALKQENAALKEENKELKGRLLAVERKLKKYNVIFYGLQENLNPIEDHQKLLDAINNKIKVDCRFSDIRDLHRIGQAEEDKIRPLSVEFVSFALKLEILKKAKELKGSNIFISPDYIPEDHQKQKILRQHLKLAKERNQTAYIRKDHLYVNGEKLTTEELLTQTKFDELTKTAVTHKPLQGHKNSGNRPHISPNSNTKKRKTTTDSTGAELPNKRTTRQDLKHKEYSKSPGMAANL